MVSNDQVSPELLESVLTYFEKAFPYLEEEIPSAMHAFWEKEHDIARKRVEHDLKRKEHGASTTTSSHPAKARGQEGAGNGEMSEEQVLNYLEGEDAFGVEAGECLLEELDLEGAFSFLTPEQSLEIFEAYSNDGGDCLETTIDYGDPFGWIAKQARECLEHISKQAFIRILNNLDAWMEENQITWKMCRPNPLQGAPSPAHLYPQGPAKLVSFSFPGCGALAFEVPLTEEELKLTGGAKANMPESDS